MAPPTIVRSEKKKGKERKKERVSKQKLLKGCHQGQIVIASGNSAHLKK